MLKLLRPHQWVKNVLVLLPLVLAHELHSPAKWLAASLGFIAFSLCASAVYVVNDALDVEADRQHPSKRKRPFASGRVPLSYAPALVVLLLIASGLICLRLPGPFGAMLILYFMLTLGYSLYWKTRLLVDVMLLGGLYTLRILAGGFAVQVPVSPWLMAFSIFLFVSLAFAKRYTELARAEVSELPGIKGRAYLVGDLRIIESVGPTSGYLAVLVLALYINSDIVRRLYPSPIFLWALCPLLMYWITRVWFFARRGAMDDDPITFAVRDRVSWYVAVCAFLLVVGASRNWQLS